AMLESRFASARGMIRLCLPLGVVKRLLRDDRETITATELTVSSPSLPIAEPLADTPVSVRAYLQVPAVPLNELLHLEPGSVINLRVPANEPFSVCIGEIDKFVARAGTANGRTALQLLGEDDSDSGMRLRE
ncbi:MAG: FliM/FliN family flagellar motor switch protein, partial [Bacteroidota bacterium]